jgi:YHS domain-containing protein
MDRSDKWKKLKGKSITACGGVLKDPSKYPSREYNGMRLYFCYLDCMREFDRNPDAFMEGKIVHPIGRQG